jgi:hypothetical protein
MSRELGREAEKMREKDWEIESPAGGITGGYMEGLEEGPTDDSRIWSLKNRSFEVAFDLVKPVTEEEKRNHDEVMALLFGMSVEEFQDLTVWLRERQMLELMTGEIWHLD